MKNNSDHFLKMPFLFLFLLHTSICAQLIDKKFERDSGFQIYGSTLNKARSSLIEARLKIEKKQDLSNEGIKFVVQWVNHSEKAITLENVFNSLSFSFFTVLSKTDFYVPIATRSTAITNEIGRPWKMDELPFKIDDVYINNVKQQIDSTTAETTTIPGRSIYSANLRIADVIKYNPKIGARQDPNAPRLSPPAGEYKIRFSVSFYSKPPTTININELQKIPEVIVRYGIE